MAERDEDDWRRLRRADEAGELDDAQAHPEPIVAAHLVRVATLPAALGDNKFFLGVPVRLAGAEVEGGTFAAVDAVDGANSAGFAIAARGGAPQLPLTHADWSDFRWVARKQRTAGGGATGSCGACTDFLNRTLHWTDPLGSTCLSVSTSTEGPCVKDRVGCYGSTPVSAWRCDVATLRYVRTTASVVVAVILKCNVSGGVDVSLQVAADFPPAFFGPSTDPTLYAPATNYFTSYYTCAPIVCQVYNSACPQTSVAIQGSTFPVEVATATLSPADIAARPINITGTLAGSSGVFNSMFGGSSAGFTLSE